MKGAEYFSHLEGKIVRCRLCPHGCIISDNKTGICRSRINVDGELYALTFNKFTSINLDPIEKKPLYHFHPGSKILSVGTTGCNLSCSFCQNWQISQVDYNSSLYQTLTKETALKLAKDNNSVGIAYTYNEPLINYEWVIETSEYFRQNDLKNVLVSNGYINTEPLERLAKFIDAANIDIKAMNNKFYRGLCNGKVEHVLNTVEVLHKNKVHVEITNLIIPGENDSAEEIGKLVDWISKLDACIPLHFSRYFPQYKMNAKVTPEETLKTAYDIAVKKLKFVHLGNI